MTNATVILNNKKIVGAWCMYDWANSVYSLVITSAIFPVYYQAVTTQPDGSDVVNFFGFDIVNSVLYSYTLSFSFLLITPLLPILSGIADYRGNKKSFLKFFAYLGGFSCMGLFFFNRTNLEWGIICSLLASIGYAGSLVFYDAFLPEIVTADRYDKTSARGYSMGYYGGVALLIINLVVIQFWSPLHFPDEGTAVRFAFLTVGVWWIGFAQYTFYHLPEVNKPKAEVEKVFLKGYQEIQKVWRNLKHLPNLKKYLLAYFFFNMGVQTVMYLAASFGAKELKLKDSKLIITVLLIQLVASAGAFAFARLSAKKGNKFSLMVMILIWIGNCIGAYFVTTAEEFYALAFVVGIVMGGIQSLSRATYSKLIPADSSDHASYFSFFDITFNLSIVCGTFSYGLVEHLTGSMRNSTLALTTFFIIGMILLSRVTIDHPQTSHS
jgi:MFS transporter, UMF1 family